MTDDAINEVARIRTDLETFIEGRLARDQKMEDRSVTLRNLLIGLVVSIVLSGGGVVYMMGRQAQQVDHHAAAIALLQQQGSGNATLVERLARIEEQYIGIREDMRRIEAAIERQAR